MYTESEYQAYRKVQRIFALEDAKAQVWWWKEFYDSYDLPDDFFDYDVLVDNYFQCHDCNVAENDMWQSVITTYVYDEINKRMEGK